MSAAGTNNSTGSGSGDSEGASTGAPNGAPTGAPATGDSTSSQATWYTTSVQDIRPEERALLEQYSGLASSEVLPHVLALRDRAFNIWSYACIGQMRFLSFNLPRLPFAAEILTRLRAGATFCDAGCCFGQELRHLAFHEKIPAAQLYGFDLEQGFVDMGYELFNDGGNTNGSNTSETSGSAESGSMFGAHFAVGDVLAPSGDPSSGSLDSFAGKCDVVFASAFLHVFDWDDQLRAVKRLVSFSTAGPGAIVCGRQLGSLEAGSFAMPSKSGSNYRHNPDSWRRFWKQVGEETGTQWEVECDMYGGTPELTQNSKVSWLDANARMLWFKVTKL